MDYAGANRAYTESSILTAPPERLVVMLYDGAIRFLKQAAVAERSGQQQMFLDRLRRAEAIIDELTVTLDHDRGGVIASRLHGIYTFSRRQLLDAWRDGDADKIDEVSGMLSELRDAWAEIEGS